MLWLLVCNELNTVYTHCFSLKSQLISNNSIDIHHWESGIVGSVFTVLLTQPFPPSCLYLHLYVILFQSMFNGLAKISITGESDRLCFCKSKVGFNIPLTPIFCTLTLKPQESSWKTGWKSHKSQRSGRTQVKQFIQDMTKLLHSWSHGNYSCLHTISTRASQTTLWLWSKK